MSVNDYDEELYDRIQNLVGELELDEKSAAYGIAMQVVHQGYNSLTEKQRYVYDAQIIPLLKAQGEEEEMNRLYDPD